MCLHSLFLVFMGARATQTAVDGPFARVLHLHHRFVSLRRLLCSVAQLFVGRTQSIMPAFTYS